jgi:hypothetical protein
MNAPKQISWLILAFLLAACAQTGPAEAPKQQAQKPPIKCNIALPYQTDQISDCSPQAAAAYDFAFCSLHYQMTSLSAPPSDRALGANSKAAAFNRKGLFYAKISEALSNASTHEKNVGLAKQFYESLKGQAVAPALDYVRAKCENVEGHHADALNKLAEKVKREKESAR